MADDAAFDCSHCAQFPNASHEDWHPTRGQLAAIGTDLLKRATAREAWDIKTMPDDALTGYHAQLERQLATADEDGLPDFLVDLALEWFNAADKELGWRRRASKMGGPPVKGGGDWVPRIQAVKRDVDLAMLIAYECAGAKPAGPGKWTCCCPFHDDRTPSLDIDVVKGLWLCRACNVGGDAITYMRLRHGLDFKQAIENLEARLGIVRPEPAGSLPSLLERYSE
jgi:hypothetical protein